MEMAWGIIMTGFTLFGMLTLVIASMSMEERAIPFLATQDPGGQAIEAPVFKKAAYRVRRWAETGSRYPDTSRDSTGGKR